MESPERHTITIIIYTHSIYSPSTSAANRCRTIVESLEIRISLNCISLFSKSIRVAARTVRTIANVNWAEVNVDGPWVLNDWIVRASGFHRNRYNQMREVFADRMTAVRTIFQTPTVWFCLLSNVIPLRAIFMFRGRTANCNNDHLTVSNQQTVLFVISGRRVTTMKRDFLF